MLISELEMNAGAKRSSGKQAGLCLALAAAGCIENLCYAPLLESALLLSSLRGLSQPVSYMCDPGNGNMPG